MPEHTITWSHIPHLYIHKIIQNSGLRLVLKHAFNVQRGAAGGVSHTRKWQTDINAFNDTYCHLFCLKWYSCPSLILLRVPCHIKNPKGGLQAFKHLMWAISVFRSKHNKKAKPHTHNLPPPSCPVMSLFRSAPVQLLTFQLYQLWIGEFPPTLMYQKSFRDFFVGIETSIFHRLGCWVEGWEVGGALLCFAFRPQRSVGMKNILSSLDLLVVLFFVFFYTFLLCSFYSQISLMHSELPLSFLPYCPIILSSLFYSLPFFSPCPLPLLFSSIHLKSGSFPGEESVVELRETTASDLFIVLRVFVVLLRLFLPCVSVCLFAGYRQLAFSLKSKTLKPCERQRNICGVGGNVSCLIGCYLQLSRSEEELFRSTGAQQPKRLERLCLCVCRGRLKLSC